MTGKLLVGIGVWLLSDALYSLALYLGKESWRGDKQNWYRDHWVRAVRGILGIVIILAGVTL